MSAAPATPTKKPRRTGTMGQRGRETARKREALVKAITEGMTIAEACHAAGCSEKSYAYYRANDPEFKARIDVARLASNKSLDRGWTGDFASFRDTFFPLEYPTPAFHMDIIKKVEHAPLQSITLINVFPNSGKSTLLEDFVNFKLAIEPDHRFVIVSKTQQQARKMLGRIQSRMVNLPQFPEYIGRFGPFYVEGQEREGKPWTRDYCKVFKNESDERDYSIQVMGWTGQVLGARVDTLILDDIQTGDNLNAVEDMIDKFRREYFTRLKGGRIVIIGNRIANADIYERLIELDIVTPGQHFDYPAVDYQGNSLWPERWPIAELDVMRKGVGEKVWWTTYQQKPQLAGNATFDDTMIEGSKDWTRKAGAKKPGEPCLLAVDPGLDPGATAIVAMTYDSTEMRVVDAEKHTTFSQQEDILNLIESFAMRYNPQHVVIETVAYQRALARDERLVKMARSYGFQVVQHNTGRNKLDPVMGVSAMASSFIREEFRFPWADPSTIARMDPVIAEFRAWRPNVPTKLITQDFVMACWFGWLQILNLRHGMGIKTDAWKRSALPWHGTPTPGIRTLRVAS